MTAPILNQLFPDKKEIGLAACGDWHYGAKTCLYDSVQKWVDMIRDNQWYVILMGDLTENALPSSVGSVFEQVLSPAEQIAAVVEILEPIKDYIFGGIGGNHGHRTFRVSGIDPDALICGNLGVPYFGKLCAGRIQVGSANWRIMAHHGAGGGALLGSKLNVIAEKMTKIMPMEDLYLAGHTHADVAGSDKRSFVSVSGRGVKVRDQVRHFSGTGSLLDYSGSYAEAMLLPPASPVQVVHFIGDRVHCERTRRDGSGDNKWKKPYRREPHYFW